MSYDGTLLVFLILTVIIGGAAAYVAGAALARTWRPVWHVVFYMLIMAAALRFLHFALFEERLLSFSSYLIDAGVLLACGLLGFRITQTSQMVKQYFWKYRKKNFLSWEDKAES